MANRIGSYKREFCYSKCIASNLCYFMLHFIIALTKISFKFNLDHWNTLDFKRLENMLTPPRS